MASFVRKVACRPIVSKTALQDLFKYTQNPQKFILREGSNSSCNLLMSRHVSIIHRELVDKKQITSSSKPYSTQASDENLGYLVYQGRQSQMFKLLKRVSLSTSAITLCLQPYLIMSSQDMPLVTAIPVFTLMGLFVFGNPILIHMIAKKYVLRMYFDDKTKVFTAKRLTFWAQEQSLSFTADDVEVPDVPSPFSMFKAKGNPLFAFEGDFTSMEVYKHMMGFDKPLDLTVDVPHGEEKNK